MRELIVATGNKGKLEEIRELLGNFDIKITSLKDYSDLPEIVEDGKTFEENAIKKALTISTYTGKLVMGEDSGIEVEPLGDRPGIYSARYSGEDATDASNNAKLLKELDGVPLEKRKARYRCCIAVSDGDKLIHTVRGSCVGLIALEEKGTNGFGYDPLFMIPEYGKTFGELDPSVKLQISHRAKALKEIMCFFRQMLG